MFGHKVYIMKIDLALDYLDSICYLNLHTMGVFQLYFQAVNNNMKQQKLVLKTSVSITFILLLCVVIFHVINTLLEVP